MAARVFYKTLRRNWFTIVAVILILLSFAAFHYVGPMIWKPFADDAEIGGDL